MIKNNKFYACMTMTYLPFSTAEVQDHLTSVSGKAGSSLSIAFATQATNRIFWEF